MWLKLIVWLWNYWNKYENTRHNIWFYILDKYISNVLKLDDVFQKKFKWEFIQYKSINNKKNIIFLKPLTYVNLSWECVLLYKNFYNIEIKDILIIHDDLDLEFLDIRTKIWGWNWWHNWLKSLDNLIWKDYSRIRIWIWRPIQQMQISDYVLSKFSIEQIDQIEKYFDKIFILINWFINN